MYHIIYDHATDFSEELYTLASEDDSYRTLWYETSLELLSALDHNIADPTSVLSFLKWKDQWKTFSIIASFPELPTLKQIQAHYPELLV